jgi:hypothetical protein
MSVSRAAAGTTLSDRAPRDPGAHGATAPRPPATPGEPVLGAQAKPPHGGAGA